MYDRLAYPEHDHSSKSWFKSTLFNEANVNQLTDMGRAFVDKCRNIYTSISDSTRMAGINHAIKLLDRIVDRDEIHELESYEDLVDSSPIMRRFIMAAEDIRIAFQKQRIDGYGDNYYDAEPGVSGSDHYDFRLVNQGMLRVPMNSTQVVVSEYLETLNVGDRALSTHEKNDILASQSLASYYLKQGLDPTRVK
jgi:hypothetical protein